jgi:hypothetical protein
MGYNPCIDKELIYPEVPSIEVLEKEAENHGEPFRILARPYAMLPNTHQYYGFASASGYDAVEITRYRKLYSLMAAQGRPFFYIHQITRFRPGFFQILDLLNVRYLLSEKKLPVPPKGTGRFAALPPAGGQTLSVYENRGCLPRAFLIKNYEALTDDGELLERIGRPDFRPDKVLLLEEDVPGFKGGTAAEDPPAFLSYGINRVLLEANPTEEAFLVLLDAHFPGWKVRVRKNESSPWREETLYRAYYAFRAVRLSPGSQEIEFSYEPFWFRLGAFSSLLTLGILAAAFFLSRRPKG